mmetsp:Transcript_33414/g.72275  ORF Transcript_33414/g.72275 Transcript_33414/m.72275 type:complete len:216 (+) Transcript_33414:774-1421(+)
MMMRCTGTNGLRRRRRGGTGGNYSGRQGLRIRERRVAVRRRHGRHGRLHRWRGLHRCRWRWLHGLRSSRRRRWWRWLHHWIVIPWCSVTGIVPPRRRRRSARRGCLPRGATIRCCCSCCRDSTPTINTGSSSSGSSGPCRRRRRIMLHPPPGALIVKLHRGPGQVLHHVGIKLNVARQHSRRGQLLRGGGGNQWHGRFSGRRRRCVLSRLRLRLR